GRNIMDHHLSAGASAEVDGFEDRYDYGRRPNGLYIPRFRNLGKERRDYLRGFGYQGRAARAGWTSLVERDVIGADLKTQAATPGPWQIAIGGFGEMLPYHENRVTIDRTRTDKWGLPVLAFDVEIKENER